MVLSNDKIEALKVYILEQLRKEWIAQGHNMNGKIIDEMEMRLNETAEGVSMEFWMFLYGSIMETGVSSSKIPFSGRTGRGGKSKYIEALASYAKQRMNISNDKEAKSVAFAIAYTHKKEGMPSQGSKKYSSTGKRIQWIQDTAEKSNTKIGQMIEEIVGSYFQAQIDIAVSNFNLQI